MEQTISENMLIYAAQRGDLNAFNRLVLAYQDFVFSQAYYMLGERQSAEDAAQDTFVSAFRGLRAFRGGSFKGWLLRIVTNACYDEMRRRKRRPTTPLERLDQDENELDLLNCLADPGDPLELRAERAELAKTLRRLLDDLPPDFRAAVILVDIQGMGYEEAAQVAGIPLGTLKSRLARARQQLGDRLSLIYTRPSRTQPSQPEGITRPFRSLSGLESAT
jgi:RNA polymerase sigma-70 factor (ECF subfamily)